VPVTSSNAQELQKELVAEALRVDAIARAMDAYQQFAPFVPPRASEAAAKVTVSAGANS
jgi:hypothetical protein